MPTFDFNHAAVQRAMRLSIIEGMAFAVMMSFGEVYFVADAVRLGATPQQLGLLVALPLCVGALGALAVPRLITTAGRRKPIVLWSVGVQVAVLATIAAAEIFRFATPSLLLILACVYQALMQAAGVAWGSWYGDVVPADVRGRYFARRSRYGSIAMFVSIVVAGSLLQWLEPASAGTIASGDGGLGYAVVFSVAVVARVVCFVLLARSPEPTFGGLADARDAFASIAGADGGLARRVVAAMVLVQLAVMVGSPYFNPFMLDILELSYLEYTAGTLAVVAAKAATLDMWGRGVDRLGARAVVLLTMSAIAVIPFPWVFAQGFAVVFFAQLLSGFAWGGYEVASLTLMLDSADARRRPTLLALINALNGGAQLGGTLIGGAVLTAAGGDYRGVFLATFTFRLAALAALAVLIPAHGLAVRLRARRIRMRLFSWSADGGAQFRPMPADTEASAILDTDALLREARAAAHSRPDASAS